MANLSLESYFQSGLYSTVNTDFLEIVSKVSEENIEAAKISQDKNEIYPVTMTNNYFGDSRLWDFTSYVAQTAWDILDSQGYDMQNLNTYFLEMWTQEHEKHSLMEQHVHGGNSQIVGFYFLETPEDCSRLIVHDPRPGKVQINLPEKNVDQASFASTMINFIPQPGTLIFTNSWLPHSFGRHASDKPLKFVHFNIGVRLAISQSTSAEVI